MSTPYEKLRGAYKDQQRATVTEQDGNVHEDCMVEEFTRVRTSSFEIWRFILRTENGERRVFGPDLNTVKLCD